MTAADRVAKIEERLATISHARQGDMDAMFLLSRLKRADELLKRIEPSPPDPWYPPGSVEWANEARAYLEGDDDAT